MNSLVFSNMLHRPARTAVSIIGIGVGILLIVFTVGLANGSLRERAQRDANIGAEIMFRALGSTGFNADGFKLPLAMRSDILKVDGVAAVIPVGQTSVPASDGLTGTRLIEGVNWAEYAAMNGMTVVQGRPFADGRDEIMSDRSWLEKRNLKLGDKFNIYERDFEIVGTFEPSAGTRIKIPLVTMQNQLGGEGMTSAFLVKIKDGYTDHAVGDKLHASFPNNQIIRTSELEELYMKGVPALDVFLNVVVGVAAAISGLIILLTMYTTVTERTRQIGVLKSLGMSNLSVAWTIVQEAVLISFGGVVFGVLATYVLKIALTKWTTLTVAIDPKVVLSIVGIGIVSGMIGALYPGLRAARLDPVEALNYD
jgi:putative ABC transport system permease protein